MVNVIVNGVHLRSRSIISRQTGSRILATVVVGVRMREKASEVIVYRLSEKNRPGNEANCSTPALALLIL